VVVAGGVGLPLGAQPCLGARTGSAWSGDVMLDGVSPWRRLRPLILGRNSSSLVWVTGGWQGAGRRSSM
jgi:hypothetical protein